MSEALPKGWIEIPVEKIIDSLESGSRPRGGVKGIESGIPSIGGEHVNNAGGFNFKNIRFIPLAYYESLNKGHIENDDILIVKDGATTGKTSFIDSNFPYKKAVVNEHVFILKTSKTGISKLIFYFLWSENGKTNILANFQGSAQGGINRQFITNTIVPLPPLNEQKRIIAKLDKIMPRIAAVKARLDKVPSIIKRFRQSVLTAAVTGKLTEKWRAEHPDVESAEVLLKNIMLERKQAKKSSNKQYSFKITDEIDERFIDLEVPNTWCKTNVDSVSIFIVDCPHSTPKWTASGKLCLRTTNFLPNKLDLSEVRFVSNETFKSRILRLKPQKGDVLYSREGGILGIACKIDIDEEICLGQRMMMFRISDNILNSYFTYSLNSPPIIQHVNNLIGGSAAPHINIRDIKKYPFPLPPLEEQTEIVRQVDKLFALADRLESHYQKAKTRVDKLSQSVLAKAFRGELVITEAELAKKEGLDFESAEKLLERILEEKAKLVDSSKQRTVGGMQSAGGSLLGAVGKRKLHTEDC